MIEDIGLNRDLGYLRIGAAVPLLRLADVDFNVRNIKEQIVSARRAGIQVLSFPEMSVTGYTLGDLVMQQVLLRKAEEGLADILSESALNRMIVIIGLPVAAEQKVFNCAVIINSGKILGIVPKTYLPGYKEFYDERWFESGHNTHRNSVELAGQPSPFGSDLLFRVKGNIPAILGIEICEDLWTPFAPHEFQAVAGANVLFNLSASNEVLGKADWRRTMVLSESGRCLAAYCYVSSGIGESSNDLIFGGHMLMAENGFMQKESPRLGLSPQLVYMDVDIERLINDRMISTSFQGATVNHRPYRVIETEVEDVSAAGLENTVDAHPFVPSDPGRRAERCKEIFAMQVSALARKLSGPGLKNVVLGISGGLDSTLALLVAVKTMDFLDLPRASVHAFTLPGFGTTSRTRTNATELCRALGVSFSECDITQSCNYQLQDLEHRSEQDVVFENVQARYRTAFLFNQANKLNAIMLGTGDLTEVALGWSTFAGDQISHYDVNVSVPKTLVRYLISWVSQDELRDSPAHPVLEDILATPISPELLKPENGAIIQKSEDIIGPVELADFYLYPFIRFGTRPGKILFLAWLLSRRQAFERPYSLDELNRWLKSFITRFFANQFKRTCLPEGPKVGSVSLSPRGDWRMPSDASPSLWLEDLEEMYRKLKD